MSPVLVGVIGTCVMIALFFSRMPIAYVMVVVGFVGFGYLRTWDSGLGLLSRDVYDVFSSYGLTIIPLFILMGQFAFNAGIGSRLYETAYKMFGSVRGGLAIATVCACAAFGAVCGSSAATAATMATVGIPEMKRYGYGMELAAGSVASGGSLGILVPPSVVLIIYGILTEQSIGDLFVAAVLPSILITLCFIFSISIFCRIKPKQGPRGEHFTLRQRVYSLQSAGDTLLIFMVIMGGLFVGLFTPNEAGGVGAFAVLMVAMARRQLGWGKIVSSLLETLRTSCMVMFLIAGAVIFGHFLALTRIPFAVATWVAEVNLPSYMVVGLIVLVYLLGGCFIDAMALIMLTIPIFYPIILDLGYDPIWFGVIIVLVTQMGVITPPVGINVYVVNGIFKEIPIEKIFVGVLPMLVALIVGTGILVAFPQIVLWLPRMMYH